MRSPAPAPAGPPVRVARSAHHPLSPAQRRYWFLEQMYPGSPSQHLESCNWLEGPLDPSALEAALHDLVHRHEVLRVTFPVVGEEPVQLLDSSPLPRLERVDAPAGDGEDGVETRVREALNAPFDLVGGPLLRARLIRVAQDRHVLVLVAHHLVADGWSMDLLRSQLGDRYRAHRANNAEDTPGAGLQFVDVTAWQQRRLDPVTRQRHLLHWRSRLSVPLPVFDPPTDRPRLPGPPGRAAAIELRLRPQTSTAARALAADRSVTLFMVLQAVFAVALARFSGQRDLVVGVPVANRDDASVEQVVGPVSNVLPLRITLPRSITFGELLEQVRERVLTGSQHAELPFDTVVEQLGLRSETDRNPVFQVLFQLFSRQGSWLELDGVRVRRYVAQVDSAGIDLELLMTELDGAVSGTLRYDAGLFDRGTMNGLLTGFEALLADACARPDTPVDELDVAAPPPAEGDGLEQPSTDLLTEVSALAVGAPDRVLLSGPDGQLGAAALWRRSGAVAAALAEADVRPGDAVGLYAVRGCGQVTGLLGCWRAGAVAVPLDPSFPADRHRLAVDQAGVRVVLADRVRPPAEWPARVVDLAALPDAPAPALPPLPADRAAYIMFTSGSTGWPKGITVPHSALASFAAAIRREPGLSGDDVLLAVTTLSFDISLLELVAPLGAGARVVVADAAATMDGRRLGELLERHGATVMQATPAGWRMLLEAGWAGRSGLRALCGGEALPTALARDLGARVDELWNLYGPTEATVWATAHQAPEPGPGDGRDLVPIGRPLGHTRTVVVSGNGERAPAGARGELLLGGRGIAWGYVGMPGTTAERFRPDPWGPPGARAYLSGDVARTRADGTLVFLGRRDQQVKLRGFRIEPGEIETVVERHPGVSAAVARIHDEHLVLYVVPAAGTGAGPDIRQLREFAGRSLPSYMLPDTVVPLAALPLTPNGKVDRSALPTPASPGTPAAEAGARPADGSRARALAALWAGVLGRESVGLHDSFFERGGNSLRLAALRTRLEQELGRRIEMAELFRRPTVASFLAHLEGQERPDDEGRERGANRRNMLRTRRNQHRERT
ncbi:amino acid adenylation domain-containing protein [Streptomyces tendae]|uniref:non-ribosomal peptide synthetase n=1 Tax=Streptomyces tendae TaxID=1932 RepID=UPI003678C28C